MELKVTGVHLRDWRAIRTLDLPEQGLGWGGAIPEVVLVGGPNGSGKSTLLEWIVTGFRAIFEGVTCELPAAAELRVTLGDTPFTWWTGTGTAPPRDGRTALTTSSFGSPAETFRAARTGPERVLYVPSPRELRLPPTERKTAGVLTTSDAFVQVWSPPRSWAQSAEALLYEARWLDLNARDEGRPADAVHFALWDEAFRSLLPGRRLVWRSGELGVEVVGRGLVHGLDALSSGEKQVVLLLAELLRHWTPGSVVLLDEPELHLHPALQVRFFDALVRWRDERGGQLWLATQSTELFGHAPSGTKVLLGTAT